MLKGQISNFLRQLGLIYLSDRLRYYFQSFKNSKINKDFKKNNPGVTLPPDYLIYESFQINYQKYYTESIGTAKMIAGYFSKYIELKNIKILDWGCGPGRIIRHLPGIIGNGCEYFGTDYNSKSIKWCSQNLTGIIFNNNSLKAELPYDNDFFSAIYGISIFTHISEQLHFDWYNELYRVLKPNGIMLLTTQGDNFKVKLTGKELDKYNNGKLVSRGKTREGHRTFSTFHPNDFMKIMFDNVRILEHIETKQETGKWLPQDIWIIKK